MFILASLFVVGWVAVAIVGTQVYFLGEQSKPIHERNWNSESFEAIAVSVTGTEADYRTRVPGYRV
ncbi:MAG: hypothetical protein KME15_25970 [Drouetiella hepatica Uher 2000/2452]|jgi:hypothetical protein|uniref:Uncharacterized protein n=1 Tax=Drouetiella hepatica Uher 2000/2452 TaxID=904376 RepID=A0A951QHW9_9CYAN|nr:hypothetical protein [Drouetiella hepatica Uher 2000/2452]